MVTVIPILSRQADEHTDETEHKFVTAIAGEQHHERLSAIHGTNTSYKTITPTEKP